MVSIHTKPTLPSDALDEVMNNYESVRLKSGLAWIYLHVSRALTVRVDPAARMELSIPH